jgi:hypothetical protein
MASRESNTHGQGPGDPHPGTRDADTYGSHPIERERAHVHENDAPLLNTPGARAGAVPAYAPEEEAPGVIPGPDEALAAAAGAIAERTRAAFYEEPRVVIDYPAPTPGPNDRIRMYDHGLVRLDYAQGGPVVTIGVGENQRVLSNLTAITLSHDVSRPFPVLALVLDGTEQLSGERPGLSVGRADVIDVDALRAEHNRLTLELARERSATRHAAYRAALNALVRLDNPSEPGERARIATNIADGAITSARRAAREIDETFGDLAARLFQLADEGQRETHRVGSLADGPLVGVVDDITVTARALVDRVYLDAAHAADVEEARVARERREAVGMFAGWLAGLTVPVTIGGPEYETPRVGEYVERFLADEAAGRFDADDEGHPSEGYR